VDAPPSLFSPPSVKHEATDFRRAGRGRERIVITLMAYRKTRVPIVEEACAYLRLKDYVSIVPPSRRVYGAFIRARPRSRRVR